ncbi:hypothetical protein EZV73_19435 [Acidaminobacter sp. JC074]|uniref:DUF7686 domain-containing protein n=1 Tax=Acidaminobacter sp. JC074 TaxID=2530199 RepID=UPI001F0FDFB6|nr:hypothetical protein [Acidaminobacter sp. JC074]MCH4889765.1 hypothetical protein [Acidaminobacter sp. JC074]
MSYCDICKEKHTAIQIEGIGHFCKSCYNDMMAEVFDVNVDIEDKLEVTIEDIDQKDHLFVVSYVIMPVGIKWLAREKDGYKIELYSSLDTELKVGLWQLIEKIQRTLSYKSLENHKGEFGLKSVGTSIVTVDHGVYKLKIDDKVIDIEEFSDMLAAYEGWMFEYQFRETSELTITEDMVLKPTSIKPDAVWKRFLKNKSYYLSEPGLGLHEVLDLFQENCDDLRFMLNLGFKQEAKQLGYRMKIELDLLKDLDLIKTLKEKIDNIIWLIP